jgi:hypothetical protein
MNSLLERISRKLSFSVPPREEAFPGADSHPSTIISFERPVPAPRRLVELSMAAVRATMDEIDLADIAARPNIPDWFNIWPGEHYRFLAGLVKVMQPKVIIEIGTDCGMSALSMKKYLPADGKLVTFDLRPWQTVPEHDLVNDDFADGRLEQRIVDLADPAVFAAHRDLIQSAELFFIDGPKNISFETNLMVHLSTVDFATPPILLFDDTRLKSMLKFWRDLPYPKLDLTSFGHWSGTGMVELTR